MILVLVLAYECSCWLLCAVIKYGFQYEFSFPIFIRLDWSMHNRHMCRSMAIGWRWRIHDACLEKRNCVDARPDHGDFDSNEEQKILCTYIYYFPSIHSTASKSWTIFMHLNRRLNECWMANYDETRNATSGWLKINIAHGRKFTWWFVAALCCHQCRANDNFSVKAAGTQILHWWCDNLFITPIECARIAANNSSTTLLMLSDYFFSLYFQIKQLTAMY